MFFLYVDRGALVVAGESELSAAGAVDLRGYAGGCLVYLGPKEQERSAVGPGDQDEEEDSTTIVKSHGQEGQVGCDTAG